MTDEQKGRRLEAMNRASAAAAQYLRSCTLPFIVEQAGKFWGTGTGVLFGIGERAFVITASHVFTLLQRAMRARLPILVPTGKPGVPFLRLDRVGGYYSVDPKVAGQPDDPLDIALLELSPPMGDALGRHMHFLHMPELDMDDPSAVESQYLTFGYPHLLLDQRDDAGQLIYTPLHLISRAYRGQRGVLPTYAAEAEIAVDFFPDSARDSEGKAIALPNPKGASGCGIWRIVRDDDDYDRWAPALLRLVGIEHTWNHEANVLRGTRIGHAIAEIAHRYEDVRPAFGLSYARFLR